MHNTDTPGPAVPTTEGGHPALAFCNAGHFRDYETFLRWSNAMGWVDDRLVDELRAEANTDRGQASHVLHEIRQLQGAIRSAGTEPDDTAGYRLITRMAHQAYADAVLLPGALARWEFGRALETPLYAAALAAVDLLTDVDLRSVRVCPEPSCSALTLGRADHSSGRHACWPGATVDDREPHREYVRAIA